MIMGSIYSFAKIWCALQHVVIVKEGMPSVPAHAVEKQAEETQAEGPMLA